MKKILLSALAFSVLPGTVAVSQSLPTACQPPQAGEYLILVINQTNETPVQLQQALPSNTNITVCRYLDNIVTRLSGWTRLEDANGWAQYINQSLKLPAFVAKQPAPENQQQSIAAKPEPPISNNTKPPDNNTKPPANTTKSTAYNPQPLSAGYAVLVNFYNKPELATKVRQTLGRNIGLVSYGQRPYLLAIQTTNHNDANHIFQQLSDRGFWTTIVDSRRVTLLKASVGN